MRKVEAAFALATLLPWPAAAGSLLICRVGTYSGPIHIAAGSEFVDPGPAPRGMAGSEPLWAVHIVTRLPAALGASDRCVKVAAVVSENLDRRKVRPGAGRLYRPAFLLPRGASLRATIAAPF
jgi:hypothetical protein